MVVDAVKDTWELGCKLKEILPVLGVEFKMLKRVTEHGTGACIYRQDQDLEHRKGYVTRDQRCSRSSCLYLLQVHLIRRMYCHLIRVLRG